VIRLHRLTGKLAVYGVLILVALVILLPFVMMVLGSFRSHVDIIRRGPLALPQTWSLDNVRRVLVTHQFGRYYVNSIILTAPTVLGGLLGGVLAAYPLSFMVFRFKGWFLLAIVTLGVIISDEFIMIPLFRLMHRFGMVDTYTSAILPQAAMSACFATLVIRSFFLGLPRELIDSGLMDGASSWQILWRILVPIARPALVTAGALTAVWTWNGYILPLILLHSPDKAPLTLGLVLFQGQYTANIPLIMTGASLTALPMIGLYLALQRPIVWGLTQGLGK